MEQIISDIEKLEVFPEVGFDADEKYGSKISHYHSTKGYTLSKDYIVLYHIEGKKIGSLLITCFLLEATI